MARRRSGGGKRRRRNAPSAPTEKQDKLYFDGEVEKALPNTMFVVRANNGMQVLATICGRMRRRWIRVLPGDAVSLEVSAYDPTRGRITYRHGRGRPAPAVQ